MEDQSLQLSYILLGTLSTFMIDWVTDFFPALFPTVTHISPYARRHPVALADALDPSVIAVYFPRAKYCEN